MLYGGVAWSELPISTSKDQEANGEIFEYGFLIDEGLGFNLEVQGGKIFNLSIAEDLNFSVNIKSTISNIFEIEQVQEFTLDIDKDNTWSLL